MFRRKWCLALGVAVVGSAFASADASAACHVGNPTYCELHPRPNITVFCGRERANEPFVSSHDFRGCRVRIGGAEAKCGQQSDRESEPGSSTTYGLTGCVVTFGASRVMAGCESSGFLVSGHGGQAQECGVSPVATCTMTAESGLTFIETATTCGQEPVVLTCFDGSYPFSPTVSYCELVVGPSTSPILSCRIDRTTPDAALASLTDCLTDL
jgi:hypothetical protein